MSRPLSVIVGSMMISSVAQAAVFFEPPPVPCSDGCPGPYGRIDPYYERQLRVLSRPGAVVNVNVYVTEADGRVRVETGRVPLTEPAALREEAGEPLYYRKGDLAPRASRTPESRPTTTVPKGAILIIPKGLIEKRPAAPNVVRTASGAN